VSTNTVSLRFSEKMAGSVSFDPTLDYEAGFRRGYLEETACSVSLVLEIADVDLFLRDPESKAVATGYVDCPKLGGRFVVEKGLVNLLVDVVPRRHRFKDFRYRLLFRTPDGAPMTLSGVKFVDDDGIIHLWRDTTKLFTKIFQGDVALRDEDHATVVAVGILHLSVLSFLKMMVLVHSVPSTPAAWISGMSRFLRFFIGSLWQVYGWGKAQ
jgi:cholesterol oxidase